jgi:hypothetical protein
MPEGTGPSLGIRHARRSAQQEEHPVQAPAGARVFLCDNGVQLREIETGPAVSTCCERSGGVARRTAERTWASTSTRSSERRSPSTSTACPTSAGCTRSLPAHPLTPPTPSSPP